MREEYIAAEVYDRRPFYRHITWSAIVAGLVVALVAQILLTMLGISIGAATIQPLQEQNPAEGMGRGAGIWWFITGLISLFIGAYVSGRYSGVARKKGGAWHGFLMWSSATALTFMLAGTLMGGLFGTGFSALAEPGNRQQIIHEVEQQMNQMGIGDQSRADARADYNGPMRGGSDAGLSDDEDRVSPANPYARTDDDADEFETARRNTLQRENVEGMTDTAGAGVMGDDPNRVGGNTNLLDDEQRANVGGATGDAGAQGGGGAGAESEVRQTAEDVASAASKGALIGLLILLIGAGVCLWGGAMGAPHDAVPPREHDTRLPAAPGEPVRG